MYSRQALSLDALKKIDNKNAQGEYYLTDVFEIMIREGQKVIPVAAEDADETMGVNSRVQPQLQTGFSVLERQKS